MADLVFVKTVFRGTPWSYVKAPEQLIIVLPVTEKGRIVCISQKRPTFHDRVISPVMGTFRQRDPIALLENSRKEVQSETGHVVKDVNYIMTIARSSGLTDETAHIYVAIVDDVPGEQSLHSDEDIVVVYYNSLSDLQRKVFNPDSNVIDSSLPYFLLEDLKYRINDMVRNIGGRTQHER